MADKTLTQDEIKALKHVHTFGDGAVLLVNEGETDDHGLPVAYIQQPNPVKSVDAHPRHPGMVVQGDLVNVITRVPVAHVNELITAGVLEKPEPKAA